MGASVAISSTTTADTTWTGWCGEPVVEVPLPEEPEQVERPKLTLVEKPKPNSVAEEKRLLMLLRHECIYRGDYEEAIRLWHLENELK